jgi:hypothetical protein
MGDLGSKVSQWDSVNYSVETKDAYKALGDISPEDLDVWVMSGKPPADYPTELVPYLQKEWLNDFRVEAPWQFIGDGHPYEKLNQVVMEEFMKKRGVNELDLPPSGQEIMDYVHQIKPIE